MRPGQSAVVQSLKSSTPHNAAFTSCAQRRAKRKRQCECAAVVEHDTVVRKPPYWTGQTSIFSRAINLAISNPALWAVMKVGARSAMIKTAEQSGIPWSHNTELLQQSAELEELAQQLTDPSLSYPDYYLRKFHAYESGNLDWKAVCELESATASLAVTVFKHEHLKPNVAEDAMRNSFLDALQAYCEKHQLNVRAAVDVGCAGGESTRRLAARLPGTKLTGVDLSPNFLGLAEMRRRQAEPENPAACIHYVHSNAEAMHLEDRSQDLVTASYLVHELPAESTKSFLRDARRVLKPKGVVAVVDGDPWSAVQQNMPLPIASLRKSTEPWLDEYFALDLEGSMQEAGFSDIAYVPVNHRHRVMLGVAS